MIPPRIFPPLPEAQSARRVDDLFLLGCSEDLKVTPLSRSNHFEMILQSDPSYQKLHRLLDSTLQFDCTSVEWYCINILTCPFPLS
jgi:hypothetical protein